MTLRVNCGKGNKDRLTVLSNSRIISFVTSNPLVFHGRIIKIKASPKVMTLTATEFTRRFLLHLLPDKFTKIRHYGLLCSRNIQTKLLNA
ncbi:MAG: transposase [Desulfitobacteriaceae bacterium]